MTLALLVLLMPRLWKFCRVCWCDAPRARPPRPVVGIELEPWQPELQVVTAVPVPLSPRGSLVETGDGKGAGEAVTSAVDLGGDGWEPRQRRRRAAVVSPMLEVGGAEGLGVMV